MEGLCLCDVMKYIDAPNHLLGPIGWESETSGCPIYTAITAHSFSSI